MKILNPFPNNEIVLAMASSSLNSSIPGPISESLELAPIHTTNSDDGTYLIPVIPTAKRIKRRSTPPQPQSKSLFKPKDDTPPGKREIVVATETGMNFEGPNSITPKLDGNLVKELAKSRRTFLPKNYVPPVATAEELNNTNFFDFRKMTVLILGSLIGGFGAFYGLRYLKNMFFGGVVNPNNNSQIEIEVPALEIPE